MKHLLAMAGICMLLGVPAMAQTTAPETEKDEPPSAAEIDAAAKTIMDLSADAKKVAGYCAINKEMAAIPETDTAKLEAVSTKMDAYLATLGEPVAEAFGIAEVADPATEDGKKLDAAFTALEGKCGA